MLTEAKDCSTRVTSIATAIIVKHKVATLATIAFIAFVRAIVFKDPLR
jgi:hypothetical protein